jgi:hypothetical protein
MRYAFVFRIPGKCLTWFIEAKSACVREIELTVFYLPGKSFCGWFKVAVAFLLVHSDDFSLKEEWNVPIHAQVLHCHLLTVLKLEWENLPMKDQLGSIAFDFH